MLIIAYIGFGLSIFVSVLDGITTIWLCYFKLFMGALTCDGEASDSTLTLAFLDVILRDESKGF